MVQTGGAKTGQRVTAIPWPLLLLAGLLAARAASADAFIKVTRFQVPRSVRLGDRVHLSCQYELQGETLHAMKLYKDGAEFYRYTPPSSDGLGELPPSAGQRQAFGQPGVQVELASSNDRDVWLRPAQRHTAGTYKCQVIVENTFKSVSAERQLEVRNRTAGSGSAASEAAQNQLQQQPRQRHAAVQHQRQLQQPLQVVGGSTAAAASGASPSLPAPAAALLSPCLLLLQRLLLPLRGPLL